MPTLREQLEQAKQRYDQRQVQTYRLQQAKERYDQRQRVLNDPTARDEYRERRWDKLTESYRRSKPTSDPIQNMPPESARRVFQGSFASERREEIEQQFNAEYAEYVRDQEVEEFLTRRATIAKAVFQQHKMNNPDASDREAYREMHTQLIEYGFQPHGLEKIVPFKMEGGDVAQKDYMPIWSEVKSVVLGTIRGGRRMATAPLEWGIATSELISDIFNRNRAGAEVTGSSRFRDARREWAITMGAVDQALNPEEIPYGFDIAGTIGEQVPNILAAVAGGKFIAAGAKIAGNALILGSMFAQEGADAYNNYTQYAEQQGLDPRLITSRAYAGAMAYGAASAALERAIPVEVFRRIPGMKNRVTAWALGSLAEGTTEFLQSITQSGIGAGIELGQFDWNAIRMAMREAAAGIIIGGVVGATQLGRAIPEVAPEPLRVDTVGPQTDATMAEAIIEAARKQQIPLTPEITKLLKQRLEKLPTPTEQIRSPRDQWAIKMTEQEGLDIVKQVQGEEGYAAIKSRTEAMDRAIAETSDTPPKGVIPKLRAGWRAIVKLPPDLLKKIPDKNPIGRLRDAIGKGLSDEYAPPAEWTRMKREARGKKRAAVFVAEKLGRQWTKQLKEAGLDPQSPDTFIQVEAAIRGDIPIENLASPLQIWARVARTAQDAESIYAAPIHRAAGLDRKADTFEGNVGKYLKRIPLMKVDPTARVKDWLKRSRTSKAFSKVAHDKWTVWESKKLLGKFESEAEARTAYAEAIERQKSRLITKRGLKKGVTPQDLKQQAAKGVEIVAPIPPEWWEQYGVHDPRYLIARGIIETRHDAEMVQLFNTAAQKWGQEIPEGITGSEVIRWAEKNGLAALPEADNLHTLKGMYVPKTIAEDLTDLVGAPKMIERAYLAYLSAWKSSKTLWNPATHARNIYGNILVFSYLARCSALNPKNAKYYRVAIKSLVNQDSTIKFLIEKGVLGAEYYGGELKRIEQQIGKAEAGKIGQILAGIKTAQNALGNLYAAEDQLFKIAAFEKYVENGMSKDMAAEEVNKWFPNYERTGKLTRWLRKSPVGAPFISFVDQSVRIAGRGFVERPLRIAAIGAFPGILNTLSAFAIGLNPDEKELIDEEQGYFQPMLPWRNERGAVQTLDLQYIMPLANDLLPTTKLGGITIPWILSGPAATAVMEQFTGKERFTGKQVIRDEMTAKEQAAIRGRMIAQAAIPHPTITYWGTKRIWKSVTGDSEEPVAHAIIGSLIGLNIRSPYIAEKHVKQVIQNMIAENDFREAKILMDVWNAKYKPAFLTNLQIEKLEQGLKQSRLGKWRKVRDEAAEFILQGRDDDARELIDDYTKDLEIGMRPLFMAGVRYRAREFEIQGKTR